MNTMNLHNQKMELIQWINSLNDSSIINKIREIKNSGLHIQYDWKREEPRQELVEKKMDDNTYKHIY